MDASDWDEAAFFTILGACGARALLIGRQAMIALGLPVLTADYDLWVHIDDIERLNDALRPLDLSPNRPPAEACLRGRYVLEGDEHVDVLVARSASAKDSGDSLLFDDAWSRRLTLSYRETSIAIPSIDDLIATKKWALRPKDLLDIQMIESVRRRGP
jgi:hypothetical protein